jgi:hypothetical protein
MTDTTIVISKVLGMMPEKERILIQSVAPQLMQLALVKGFVVDLDNDYLSLTGELRSNVINKKLKRNYCEGVHYETTQEPPVSLHV